MKNDNDLKLLILNSSLDGDRKAELLKYLEELIDKAWMYDSLN